MKSLILSAIALSFASVPTVVVAQDAAPTAAVSPKLGNTVWTADGKRLGPVDNIRKAKDGTPVSVGVIHDSRMVYVAISTLSTAPKGLATTLTLKEVNSK